MRALLLAMALLAAPAALAQAPATPDDLPAAVTEGDISVTSNFRGFTVTVFGANPDRRGRGDVVVAVRGPEFPATISRKTRFWGLWVNGAPVTFMRAPGFHAVLSTRPLRNVVRARDIWALKLDPAASAELGGAIPSDADPSAYREALVRLRRHEGLYLERASGVSMLSGGRLFLTQVRIPANAPLGNYRADAYFFRNGRMVSSQTSIVNVSRVGVEQQVHELATDHAFLYGLAVVAMALGAGYAAAAVFRRV